eukprot:TRINITY_DN9721_c0_g2_i6.p1 TRINITY_DN9721_c0_g2~~TRINITY_DN9721_c0_g2_i6.p1  ORF type:complete len:356 (+),score=51.19 TRINITY_DN9721_c0_g2_i6:109-1176(+)
MQEQPLIHNALFYSNFIKAMSEFMQFLARTDFALPLLKNEIYSYHWIDSNTSLFNKLLLYFFAHKSANPLTEYRSFMQTLASSKNESHGLLLQVANSFCNDLPMVTNSVFQFYLKLYHLLASYAQRIPLYGLLKIGFSVFEDHLEASTMSLLLHLLTKIPLYDGNGQLMDSWRVLMTLLAVQSEPVFDKVKAIRAGDLNEFIKLLNNLEVYLPSKDSRQLEILLDIYKENSLESIELSGREIVLAMEEAFAEGSKVYCTALDAAAVLTAFAEEVAKREQFQLIEVCRTKNSIPLVLSQVNSKGYTTKKFLEFVYLEMYQENYRNMSSSTMCEVISKKWLVHFIFKEFLDKLNTIQ